MNLSVEDVLMFALVVCALYYLMGKCGCRIVEGITSQACMNNCTYINDCDKPGMDGAYSGACVQKCEDKCPRTGEDTCDPNKDKDCLKNLEKNKKCMNDCVDEKQCQGIQAQKSNAFGRKCMHECNLRCPAPP